MLPARTHVVAARESLWHVDPLRVDAATPMPVKRLDRVRRAATAFVRGTTLGWGRRDLAEWLVCHYAPCAAAPLDDDHDRKITDLRGSTAMTPTVNEAVVEQLVLDARARVLRLLADLVVPWQASPIARLAIASGTVIAQRDERGAVAYSPVSMKRLRLADRAASLFIADYLNQQTDYRWLMVCRECGELSFATELEHASWCEAPPEQWMAFTAAEAIALAAG